MVNAFIRVQYFCTGYKGATCNAARYLTKGNREGIRCTAADNCSNDGADCCTQKAQCKTDPDFCSTVSTAAVAAGGYVLIDAQENTYCVGQACDNIQEKTLISILHVLHDKHWT